MDFTILQSDLAKSCATVARALPSKPSLPILSGIKISLSGGKLTFLASNLELAIECSVGVQSLGTSGDAVIPGKTFIEAARSLPSGQIDVRYQDNLLELRYGKSSIKFNCFTSDEFPIIPDLEGERLILDGEKFGQLIRRVLPAVATDAARPVFTGVLLTCDGNILTAVGTDTHRLAVGTMEVTGKEFSAIIPAKALAEAERLFSGNVQMVVEANQVKFSTDELSIISRLIEGKFPDTRQVMPKDFKTQIVMGRGFLLDTLSRAAVVAKNNGPVLLEVTSDTLTVSAQAENGKIVESLDVNCTGENVKMAFNPRYLVDAIKAVDGDEVNLEIVGELQPVLIRGADDTYSHIVLPVRRG